MIPMRLAAVLETTRKKNHLLEVKRWEIYRNDSPVNSGWYQWHQMKGRPSDFIEKGPLKHLIFLAGKFCRSRKRLELETSGEKGSLKLWVNHKFILRNV